MSHDDSLPGAESAYVARSVVVRGRESPSASDALLDHHHAEEWIEFMPAELSPYIVRADFVRRRDPETGEVERELLGEGLRRELSVKGARELPVGLLAREYAERRRAYEANRRTYQLVAELLLDFAPAEDVHDVRARALRSNPRLRLPLFIEDWRQLGGPTATHGARVVEKLARLWSVDRSRIYVWLNEAEAAGLIPEGRPRRRSSLRTT